MSWAPDSVVRDGTPGRGMRLAISGASHWHLARHAQYLREAGARFVAVADLDAAVAAKWAGELGAEVAADSDAIVRAKPDAVLLLGRVKEMAASARVFLDAGVPLLAEKPLGLTPDEVGGIAELAERKRAWVSVALVQRYDPIWDVLDRLRDAGRLGDVAHAHMRIVNGPPQRYAAWGSGWMLDPMTAGGGALLNLGIHGLDYMRHLVGGPLTVVGAALGRRAHGLPIEDFGAVTLRGGSGFVGTVESGYTYPDSAAGMTRSGDNETRVAAQKAYLVGRDANLTLVTPDEGERPVHGGRSGDRYRDWAFDSLARLRAEKAPVARVRDCLEAVNLVFAAYAAARG
ncbi:MAG: Gfo/Idh/MocA family protein [Chloroflexota bacterium]